MSKKSFFGLDQLSAAQMDGDHEQGNHERYPIRFVFIPRSSQ